MKRSVHADDAAAQLRSNNSFCHILEKYAKKWRIKKTIIHKMPNGICQNFYLDIDGGLVTASAHYVDPDDYPIIGEKIETTVSPWEVDA